MASSSMTLWHTINTLAQQIPFTQAKVERVLGVTLSDRDPRTLVFENTSFRLLEGGPVILTNGVVISKVDLRIRRKKAIPAFSC